MGAESFFFKIKRGENALQSTACRELLKKKNTILGALHAKDVCESEGSLNFSVDDKYLCTIYSDDEGVSDVVVEACLYYLSDAEVFAKNLVSTLDLEGWIVYSAGVGAEPALSVDGLFDALREKLSLKYKFFMENYAWIFEEKDVLPGRFFYDIVSKNL